MPTRPPTHKVNTLPLHQGVRDSERNKLPHRKAWHNKAHARKWRVMILSQRPLCEEEGCHNHSEQVHHIKKVRDDRSLMVDPDNVMALCRWCHSKRTARGE